MVYILTGIIVLLLCFLLLLPGGGRSGKAGRQLAPVTAGTVTPGVQKAATAGLTRAEIASRLQKLASLPPPTKLNLGAECYKVAMPPDRAEYVCPRCGSRTLYASSNKGPMVPSRVIEHEIPRCRQMVKEIKGLAVTIDESEFCRKCSPAVTSPVVILITRYPDSKSEYRTKGVSSEDLVLIREFMEGSDRHKGPQDIETPLKNHLPRLRQLLGIK